ncbi:NHLM bacteriocin system ABC transporter ATP-binding protein [Nitrospirillum amazonense]|uniref:NHLM bacteriocin system ABC transporter ATP-binding protein n=1 Tax=Nitrospirillum amazonense TaxID=28077 RepID=A0A560K3E1_9PROT|nr:NHLP bacteriocin export ABC transporter permease/ATPase subunit [Nitrospirillum amazonense]TWB77841.1 NHLM bacteriocin system ABC transporter ATP-binding protein [Nitrospirillum amazonense]
MEDADRLEGEERAARDRHAGLLALQALSGVLGGGVLGPDRGATHASLLAPLSEQPLVLAFAHLGAVLGFEVRLPPRQQEGAPMPALEALARASRVRLRGVQLDPGWWRQDSGAFLLLRPAPLSPLALSPGGRGRYTVYDPDTRVARPLPAAEAVLLAGQAYALYPPLPDQALTPGSLAKGLLRARMGDIATLAGGTLLAGVFTMGVPLAMGYLLEGAIPDSNLGRVVQVAVALALLAVMTLLLRLATQLTMLRIEGLEGSRVQAAVMDRLLRLPTGFFRGYSTGDMATRVMAVARLEKTLTASTINAVMTGMVALVSYAVMLGYSWRLGLVAIALTLMLAVVTVVLGLRRVRHEAAAIRGDARMSGLTLELASGIAKLRLAAAEDRAFLRWARLYAEASRAQFGADRAAGLLDTVGVGYQAFATAALLAACVMGGWTDTVALGLLAAFVTAFTAALEGLRGLAAAAVEMVGLAPIVQHARPILQALPEAADKADPGTLTGAIELSRVTFQYKPDTPRILDTLSVSVRPGEFVAFVGPSGTGKSTLFRLLLGFERPDAGLVLYDGVDLAGLDLRAVRRQCGVVLQHGRLMPGTLMDNVLGAATHLGQEAAWDALAQVALADEVRRMPMGLHTLITDGGTGLSGGQVQRLLLARALVARPRIMMLDEATSALDNHTQAAVTASLDKIAGTRLVIAHRLSTVRRADRIIVLNQGRVEEEGAFDTLMARDGFFAAFARRQLTRDT